MIGSYPKYALAISAETKNGVIRDRFFSKGIIPVRDYFPGIKFIKSIPRTQPHKAIGVLNDGIHGALRQAILDRKMIEIEILCIRGSAQ
jgi:hypothetical protein